MAAFARDHQVNAEPVAEEGHDVVEPLGPLEPSREEHVGARVGPNAAEAGRLVRQAVGPGSIRLREAELGVLSAAELAECDEGVDLVEATLGQAGVAPELGRPPVAGVQRRH